MTLFLQGWRQSCTSFSHFYYTIKHVKSYGYIYLLKNTLNVQNFSAKIVHPENRDYSYYVSFDYSALPNSYELKIAHHFSEMVKKPYSKDDVITHLC